MVRPTVGQKRADGKRYAGENYGYQSPATYNKLKEQGKFKLGAQALDRVGNAVQRSGIPQKVAAAQKQFRDATDKIPGIKQLEAGVNNTNNKSHELPSARVAQGAAIAAQRAGEALNVDPRIALAGGLLLGRVRTGAQIRVPGRAAVSPTRPQRFTVGNRTQNTPAKRALRAASNTSPAVAHAKNTFATNRTINQQRGPHQKPTQEALNRRQANRAKDVSHYRYDPNRPTPDKARDAEAQAGWREVTPKKPAEVEATVTKFKNPKLDSQVRPPVSTSRSKPKSPSFTESDRVRKANSRRKVQYASPNSQPLPPSKRKAAQPPQQTAPQTGRTRDNAEQYAAERERGFRNKASRIISDRLSTDKALAMSGRERANLKRQLESQMKRGARRIYRAAKAESNQTQNTTRQSTIRYTGSGRQAYQDPSQMGVTKGRTGGLTESQYRARSKRARSSVGDPIPYSAPPSAVDQARKALAEARRRVGAARSVSNDKIRSGDMDYDPRHEMSKQSGNISGMPAARRTEERNRSRPVNPVAPGRRSGVRQNPPGFVKKAKQAETTARNKAEFQARKIKRAEQELDKLRGRVDPNAGRVRRTHEPSESKPQSSFTRQRHGTVGDNPKQASTDKQLQQRNQKVTTAKGLPRTGPSRIRIAGASKKGGPRIAATTSRVSSNRGGRSGKAARATMYSNIERAFRQAFQ